MNNFRICRLNNTTLVCQINKQTKQKSWSLIYTCLLMGDNIYRHKQMLSAKTSLPQTINNCWVGFIYLNTVNQNQMLIHKDVVPGPLNLVSLYNFDRCFISHEIRKTLELLFVMCPGSKNPFEFHVLAVKLFCENNLLKLILENP